jgi:hypothetical protein
MSRFQQQNNRSRRRMIGAALAVAGGALVAVPTLSLLGPMGNAQIASTEGTRAQLLAANSAPAAAVSGQSLPPRAQDAPARPFVAVPAADVRASRGAERVSLHPTTRAVTFAERKSAPSAAAKPRTKPVTFGNPKAIAASMLASRGWSGQFSCLDSLWSKESGWKVSASNPSGAYGIPQALPGSKMSTVGPNWRTDAATQITWGLNYIADSYGSPCAAWAHSRANNWY